MVNPDAIAEMQQLGLTIISFGSMLYDAWVGAYVETWRQGREEDAAADRRW
jgi:hypothetical protein